MKHVISFILAVVMLFMALPITVSAAGSCTHRRTQNQTVSREYVQSTASEHIRIRYRQELCRSCGDILRNWSEEKSQEHSYEEGICENCGYQRRAEDIIVEETVIVLQSDNYEVMVEGEAIEWEYPPVIIEDRTMVPLTIAVDMLGGEFSYWDADTSSAYVELNGKTLKFQKNNAAYWVNGNDKTANVEARIIDGKLYVELRVLVERARRVLNYHDGYIIISNNDISVENQARIISYLYYGGVEPEETQDAIMEVIQEGKVYATSMDGKHIYKRVYDASQDCLYVDEYQFTVFNLNIPKDAVLIQEGNYLYEEGNKVLCDIKTLRQVDARISQLNKIISGAKSAYVNGIITRTRRNAIQNTANASIAEYEDVAKGEKTLEKVTEEERGYIAKIGDTGEAIEEIQQKLFELGFSSQKVTGYYGDITFNNVAYFQIVNGLVVTGWLDPETYQVAYDQTFDNLDDYFECEDQTFSEFDITSLEFAGSEYINIIVEKLGGKELLNSIAQQLLDSLPDVSDEDIGSFALGIVSSVDDNVLFGIGKNSYRLFCKVTNLPGIDENNYYYCLSKHYMDNFFVGFYTAQASALAAGGISKLITGFGSGEVAIVSVAAIAPSGGVVLPATITVTAVAATEIATGLTLMATAIVSANLKYHSQNIAYANGQKLLKTSKPISSSAKLNAAMQQAGKPKPSYSNYAAHHIVPEHATRAENARKILKRCGIDPNDAVNGVYLPTKAGQVGAGNATIHSGRHTNAYVDYVTTRLERANPQDYNSCKKVLDAIADELLNGTLKLGK